MVRLPSNSSLDTSRCAYGAGLAKEFAHPGAAWRGKPFWSWNGRLEKEELFRQLRIFQEMGMGGFFMHSRTGLKTEYLGEEWFELINACADEAEKLGLEAWLYDEDRWPSGSAGGMATVNKAYRMKSLRLSVVRAASLAWPEKDRFIAVFRAQVEGLNLGDYGPLEYGADLSALPAEERVLLFTVEEMEPHSFYNNNTYLDTLKREATDFFLSTTHEKYKARCGDRLGRSIRGIFTDEPHRGMVMCQNNEAKADANAEWTVPYTEALWAEFEKLWGYDLGARLPELFLWRGGDRISQVKWHFMELLQRLFIENWARPCQEWCRENNLLLTGHVLHEDSLVAQAVPAGSAMRYYEYLDTPGIDILGRDNQNYWVAKQLQSAARQLGKKSLLSELYGCAGWQFDFAGHKQVGQWQALFGVNLRCHHLSWYSMAGEAKRDYPGSISFQSAWYREYGAVEDYFSRLHLVLQEGEPVCDVLVINPVESAWAQIFPGWAQWLEGKAPALKALERKYEELFHLLAGSQIDFDYGDEDHLHRFGQAETGVDGPLLRLGLGAYRVVIVSGLQTIRSTTMELLEKFRKLGGAVIFVDAPPTHVDALISEAPKQLAAQAIRAPLERKTLAREINQYSRTPVRISGGAGVLFSQVRRDADGLFLVVLNTDAAAWVNDVCFVAEGGFDVQEWDCETGQQQGYPARLEAGSTRWTTAFAPLSIRVFRLVAQDEAPLPAHPLFVARRQEKLEGPFRYQLDEPNFCVLDVAGYRLGEGDWQAPEEILKIDRIVRESLGLEQRAGNMIQPWAVTKLGLSRDDRQAPLRLRFAFQVEEMPPGPVDLVLETPAEFQIRLNDNVISVPAETAWLIDPCLRRIALPKDGLRPGLNVIELATMFSSQVDLEAIYLAGDFAVFLRDRVPHLARLPERVLPGDLLPQGFPFYSGKISYQLPLPAAVRSGDRIKIATGAFGGATAKISFLPNQRGSMVAWPPHEAILTVPEGAHEIICEVYLTRVNTFGPFHLTPKERSGIGPNSFRSEGAEFSNEYQLWPAGLLQSSSISF